MKLAEAITYRRAPGPPISLEGATVTPWSRSIILRLPFGGFVWNQAAGVEVTRDGRTETLQIVDVAARARVALVIAVVIFSAVTAAVARQRKGSKEKMR